MDWTNVGVIVLIESMYEVLSIFVASKVCVRPWRAKPDRAKACQGLNVRSNHDKRKRDKIRIDSLTLEILTIYN